MACIRSRAASRAVPAGMPYTAVERAERVREPGPVGVVVRVRRRAPTAPRLTLDRPLDHRAVERVGLGYECLGRALNADRGRPVVPGTKFVRRTRGDLP